MRGGRRGIILPTILATLVVLGLLSALALHDAVQEWRVAALADDQALARAALLEAVDGVSHPPDLAALCVSSPLASQGASGLAVGGGAWRVRWHHLGEGRVWAVAEGRGLRGARARAVAHLAPDTAASDSGLFRCPAASRLAGRGPRWLERHPEG